MGADPSPSGGPPGQTKPDKSPNPNKPDKAAKPDKGPEVAVTVKGTVTKGTDEAGRPSYSVTADGKTWELSAGPSWYWGDKNPLNAYVGKSVSIVGSTHAGETELDVDTVDGKALRAGGKPPWAGGPWVVGKTHPGWKDWMADGKPGNGHGRESAPVSSRTRPRRTEIGSTSLDEKRPPAGEVFSSVTIRRQGLCARPA